jgi:L-cysteine S-thiosulfotransferase
MRFRRFLLAAFALLSSVGAHATAEQVRAEIAARLRQQVPALAPADYALGAAAIDYELHARMQENTAAAAPVVEAGRILWTRKFRNGRTLAGCFPNGGRRRPPPIRNTTRG